jgi:hypothetical protein
VSSQPFCHLPLCLETLYSSRASRTPVGAAVAIVAAAAKRKILENCMVVCGANGWVLFGVDVVWDRCDEDVS